MYLYDNHSSSAKLLSFACGSEVIIPPPLQLLGSQKVSSFSFDLRFGQFSFTADFGLENLPTSLLRLPQVFSLDRLPSEYVQWIESLQYQEVLKILKCNYIILMQSLSQFGNLSVRFDMCITLKKLRSQNCTVKLHKLLHCWQSFPNEKAPFCIMERTKILMARF